MIAVDNGKKFCECKKKGNEVILSTKQGDIELLDLMEQITNYRSTLKNEYGDMLMSKSLRC